MITDIPTNSDFEQSGISFLNQAWDVVIQLLSDLDNAQVKVWDDDGSASDEYWMAAQSSLLTALALTQQGTEFLLKSRIVSISPLLLIAGNSNEWPRGCDKNNISFVEFRTIDAQDLIRVHDTFAENRLPETFIERFKILRKLRNNVIHTVNKNMRVTPQQIITEIGKVSTDLLPLRRWIDIRSDYLEKAPASVSYSTDDLSFGLAWETSLVIDELQPREAKDLFGFNKRQRSYICLKCVFPDADFFPKFAQLEPNTPDSTMVYCFVCNQRYEVSREKCGEECKGNVIDKQTKICLTCQQEQ